MLSKLPSPRKLLRTALVLVVLVLARGVLAAEWTWQDEDGKPVPNTEARKSIKGFGGWLLVTSDTNWEQMWDAPTRDTPRFTEASVASPGDKLFVLILFANPALSREGHADVVCDIDVERPDGTYSVHQHSATCFKGKLQGSPADVYLALPVVGFVGDEADPTGQWVVKVLLKDNLRHVRLLLKTSFALEAKRPPH